MESVSEYFLSLNESRIKEYDGPVITLSHFLPRRELLHSVERLSFKGQPLVARTLALDRQVRELDSTIHVFGNSHIDFDQVIEEVRYIHHAFDYPPNVEIGAIQLPGRGHRLGEHHMRSLIAEVGRNCSPACRKARWSKDFVRSMALVVNAERQYTPRPYPGIVTLLVTLKYMLEDQAMGWGSLVARGVRLVEVPGTRSTLLNNPYA